MVASSKDQGSPPGHGFFWHLPTPGGHLGVTQGNCSANWWLILIGNEPFWDKLIEWKNHIMIENLIFNKDNSEQFSVDQNMDDCSDQTIPSDLFVPRWLSGTAEQEHQIRLETYRNIEMLWNARVQMQQTSQQITRDIAMADGLETPPIYASRTAAASRSTLPRFGMFRPSQFWISDGFLPTFRKLDFQLSTAWKWL